MVIGRSLAVCPSCDSTEVTEPNRLQADAKGVVILSIKKRKIVLKILGHRSPDELRYAWRLLIGSVVAAALIWPLVFWGIWQPQLKTGERQWQSVSSHLKTRR